MRPIAEAPREPPETAAQAAAAHACRSCGTTFRGNYCPECGEKVYREHDKSMRHVAEEVLHFATHLDGRFAKTLGFLFARPGLVARDYAEGRRRPYVKPVTLFMLTVLACLLFPLFKGMNIEFAEHVGGGPAHGLLQAWAERKAAAEGLAEPALAARFDAASPKVAKVALLVLLPLSAALLALLFARPRRMFFDHLLIATELNTTFLLMFFIALPLLSIAIVLARLPVATGDGSPLSIAWVAAFATVCGLALKRFYALTPATTVLRTAAFLVGYALVFFLLYRLVAFALVMLVV